MADLDRVFTKARPAHRGWEREAFPFSELIRRLAGECVPVPWVTESAMGPWQYRIIRASTHDGTCMFTDELLRDAAAPLIEKTSAWAKMMPMPSALRQHHVRYEVGRVRHARVFGTVAMPCGRYPGVRESITIPVRCIWEIPNG